MLILITYDVSTQTPEGRKRLSNVAKVCKKFGQRVQNSVFECCLDYANYLKIQSQLENEIDKSVDSLRFYNLGNDYHKKVVHLGAKSSLEIEGIIIV